MIPLSLRDIAGITGARLDQVADPAAVVTGPVTMDSRAAAPGALFAALPGSRADGHDFAAQAVAAGATAVLASRPCGAPALIVPDVTVALGLLARAVVDRLPSLEIAGITGSAGKTTTKDLAAQLIEALGPTVGPASLVEQRDRPPADRAARHRGHPLPGAGAVRAGPRAHRAAVPDRAAAARRGALRGPRARGGVRQHRGGGWGQG